MAAGMSWPPPNNEEPVMKKSLFAILTAAAVTVRPVQTQTAAA